MKWLRNLSACRGARLNKYEDIIHECSYASDLHTLHRSMNVEYEK